MRWRRWLAVTAAGAGILAVGYYWLTLPQPFLTVVSWGDEYGRAQAVALFHPFTDQSGVAVETRIYNGGMDEIARQVNSNDVRWDVVDMEVEDAAKACRDGLLERLDGLDLPSGTNGAKATEDFVLGALGPCWVGTAVYSQVIAFAKGKTGAAEPSTLADFFDLKTFPGPRALRDNGPKYNLELALLADGVSPFDVYPTLATETGIARALAKLDTIKPIVWWRRTAEPPELLASGKAVMATALNGRVFDVSESPRFGTIFDGQLYQMDAFGVPKGTPKKNRAFEFLRFAAGTKPLAEMARLMPLGPARLSSLTEIDPARSAQLPTAPDNLKHALFVDPGWWAEHGATMESRWNEWRAK